MCFRSSCSSGKRDRAEYHSLLEFTDEHMHSDYHFLEDVERVANNAHREAYKLKLKVNNLSILFTLTKSALCMKWVSF